MWSGIEFSQDLSRLHTSKIICNGYKVTVTGELSVHGQYQLKKQKYIYVLHHNGTRPHNNVYLHKY